MRSAQHPQDFFVTVGVVGSGSVVVSPCACCAFPYVGRVLVASVRTPAMSATIARVTMPYKRYVFLI